MTSPRWPKAMLKRTALEYCDLTEAAFEKEIAAGRLPCAFVLGGKQHWHKEALDKALARLAGNETGVSEAKERFWNSGKAA